MVKLNKIYTRTGDDGTTGLGDGTRVSKTGVRLRAIGDIDELNCCIGLLIADGGREDLGATLLDIQHDLFDLGADLCRPEHSRSGEDALRITTEQVERLEIEIDGMNAELEPLGSFVLPGGSEAAAYLHLARTVVRRAERLMTELAETEAVNAQALKYVNRLSDHLFQLARRLNENGKIDVLWVPGANR